MLRSLEGKPGYFYEEVPLPGLLDRPALIVVHDMILREIDEDDGVRGDWAVLLPAILEGKDVKLDPRLRFSSRLVVVGGALGAFWGTPVEWPETPGRWWRQSAGGVLGATYRDAVAEAYGRCHQHLVCLLKALSDREAFLSRVGALENLTDLIDFGGGPVTRQRAVRLIEPLGTLEEDDDVPF